MDDNGHNYMMVGLDLMTGTLFFFLCLAAISRPVVDGENLREKESLQQEVHSLKSQLKALRDVRVPTASGTEVPAGPAIDLYVKPGSISIQVGQHLETVRQRDQLAVVLRRLSGEKLNPVINVYADIKTSFQAVVSVLDIVQRELPESTTNIGVAEN